MNRIERLLLAGTLAAGLTLSGYAALAQNDAAPAAPAATETAPAAPEAAATPDSPPAEGAKPEAVTAPESAPAEKAEAPAEKVSDGDLLSTTWEAVMQKNWGAVVAAVMLIIVVAASRGWVMKIPGLGPLIGTDFGGMVYTFTLAGLGAAGHGYFAGGAWTAAVAWTAVKVGGLAIGGWSGILKKTPWVKDKIANIGKAK